MHLAVIVLQLCANGLPPAKRVIGKFPHCLGKILFGIQYFLLPLHREIKKTSH